MSLYRLDQRGDLTAPTLLVAFDGWVDAGSAATTALEHVVGESPAIATFDADELFDYRARRPPLEIVDGRLAELSWPELLLRHVRIDERDLLVLVGPEPDYRWREMVSAVLELSRTLGVAEWISLGAIPAAVPHTRPVPILGTESEPGLLRADVAAGPAGILRVPSALVSALEFEVSHAGIPSVGLLRPGPALHLRAVPGGGRGPARDRSASTWGSRSRRATSPTRRSSCAPGSTPRPRSRRRRGPTSSASSRWSTKNGSRPATT